MKTCNTCGRRRRLSSFYTQKQRGADYRLPRCKDCEKKRTAARKAAYTPEQKAREEASRRKIVQSHLYKITPEWYAATLAAQGGGCAICGSHDPGKNMARFCVDHDHACCPGTRSCGKCNRGLLCRKCNAMLGHANDSPALLRGAAAYLETVSPFCASAMGGA